MAGDSNLHLTERPLPDDLLLIEPSLGGVMDLPLSELRVDLDRELLLVDGVWEYRFIMRYLLACIFSMMMLFRGRTIIGSPESWPVPVWNERPLSRRPKSLTEWMGPSHWRGKWKSMMGYLADWKYGKVEKMGEYLRFGSSTKALIESQDIFCKFSLASSR